MRRQQERLDSKKACRIVFNQVLISLLSPNEEHGLLQNLASSYGPKSSAKGVGVSEVDKFCGTSRGDVHLVLVRSRSPGIPRSCLVSRISFIVCTTAA